MDRPRDALPEGTKLAGYIIGPVLGRGGFGITYLAADALYPSERVAIKEYFPNGLAVRQPGEASVHPSSGQKEQDFKKLLARFEAEARILTALRHPNVVKVERYIELNGTAYIAMKYEDGKSLAAILAGGATMSEAEIDEVLPPLLDGIEAVHARDFLHRDITPSNIYIRTADGSPVLLDFGAARQALGQERKTSLTEIVAPGYAPFEQYFRKGEQGPWSDIYALGATLYRCVTGERPPEAPERMRETTPLSCRALAKGPFRPELLAAIDRALAVDADKRPQSISEFRALLAKPAPAADRDAGDTLVADVEIVRRAEPEKAWRGKTERPETRKRQRAVRWVIAAVVAALVLGGGGIAAVSTIRAERERARIAAEEETRRRNAEAERAAEEARKAERERQRIAAEEETRRRNAEAERERQRKSDEQADLEKCGTAQQDVAACTRLIESGNHAGPSLGALYHNRAYAKYTNGRHQDAIADYTKAIEFSPDSPAAFNGRGAAFLKLRLYSDAIRDFDTAIALDPRHANAYYNRGLVHQEQRQLIKAVADMNKAIEISGRNAVFIHNRGLVHLDLQQYPQAIADFSKTIEIDPRHLNAYINRGTAYSLAGQSNAALRDFDKAIQLEPKSGHAYFNRATVHEKLQDRIAAIRDYRQAHRLGYPDAAAQLRRLQAPLE